MSQITFEKLKEKCVREFCSKNNLNSPIGNTPTKLAIAQLVELRQTGKFKNPRKLLEEIREECIKTIKSVDIRNIKPLIELCPDSVPAWIKKGSYFIDSDGWIFVRLYEQKNLVFGQF